MIAYMEKDRIIEFRNDACVRARAEKTGDILLSIIIPVFNLDDLIERTLSCIAEQSNEKIEIIVIDDGSSDYSLVKIIDFMYRYSDLRWRIIYQDNRGVSAARNKGLELACGRYVYFFDGDDLLYGQAISKMSAYLTLGKVDYLCFGYDVFACNGEITERYTDKRKYIGYNCKSKDIIISQLCDPSLYVSICGSIFNKRIIDAHNLKFSVNRRIGEDTEYILKYLILASDVVQIGESLFKYMKRDNSATSLISSSLYGNIFQVVAALREVRQYYVALRAEDSIIEIIDGVSIPMACGVRLQNYVREFGFSWRSFCDIYASIEVQKIMKKAKLRGVAPGIAVKLVRYKIIATNIMIGYCISVFAFLVDRLRLLVREMFTVWHDESRCNHENILIL